MQLHSHHTVGSPMQSAGAFLEELAQGHAHPLWSHLKISPAPSSQLLKLQLFSLSYFHFLQKQKKQTKCSFKAVRKISFLRPSWLNRPDPALCSAPDPSQSANGRRCAAKSNFKAAFGSTGCKLVRLPRFQGS